MVLDGIIIRTVDVRFELIHRRAQGGDVALASWDARFEPLPGGVFRAQAYELDVEAPAIDRAPGDQLVLRYSGLGSTVAMAYIPNGDGALYGGRIPNLTLPR
jgi:hypothetical protein